MAVDIAFKGLTCAASNGFAIAQRLWCEEMGDSMQEANLTWLFSGAGLPELVTTLLN